MPIKKYKYWPAIAWFITSNILFYLPGSVIPSIGLFGIPHLDKVVHFIIFFGIVYLWQMPVLRSSRKHTTILFSITGIAICYGIAVEFIQQEWVRNRSFDIGDIIADAVGSLTAYIYCRRRQLAYQKK